MPLWLVTFLTNLLEPIILSVIKNMALDSRLSSLEGQQTDLTKAVGLLANAKTPDDKKAAIQAIAKADNNR